MKTIETYSNIKCIIRLIACITVFMLLTGCLPAYSSAASSEEDGNDEGRFEIQYFFGPDAEMIVSDEEVAARIAEAGFTIASLQTSYNYINGVPGTWGYADTEGAEILKSAIKIMGDNDIKVYLRMGTLSYDLINEGVWNDTGRQLLSAYLDGGFDNVIGADLGDEPSASLASNYAAALEKIHTYFPDTESYFNLFPNYALEQQLGFNDTYYVVSAEQYEEYLNGYFNRENVNNGLNVFSIDHYPELINEVSQQEIRDAYYENLAVLLEKTDEVKGAVPMNIVCLLDTYIDPYNINHIKYQVNTNLAFGMKRISYFTCIDPKVEPGWAAAKEEAVEKGEKYGWDSGWVLEKDGSPSEIYNHVKEVNANAHNLGSLLYSKQVVSVDLLSGNDGMTAESLYGDSEFLDEIGPVRVAESRQNSLKSFADDDVTEIPAAGLVTLFDDGCFMLTNSDANKATSFSITEYNLRDLDYFDADRGEWVALETLLQEQENGSAAVQLEDSKMLTLSDTVILDGGSALVMRVRDGRTKTHKPAVQEIKKATVRNSGRLVNKCVCGKVLSSEKVAAASKIYLTRTAYTYTGGKVKIPQVVVKDASGRKIDASNYKVTAPGNVKNMKNVGRYAWKVTFKGEKYSGTKTVYMKIKPAKVKIRKLTPAGKAVAVKWSKGKKSQVTGYQVMIASDRNFTKNKKTVSIKGYAKNSVKFKKLKPGKRYYLKVSAYKKVNGVKIYSNWSNVKNVKL